MNLLDMGLALQRKSVSRKLTDHVEVVLNIAGGEWSGEAEVSYTLIPAFGGADDEPGYSEHIEIHYCFLLYSVQCGQEREKRYVDVTGLVWDNDELHDAVQTQILG